MLYFHGNIYHQQKSTVMLASFFSHAYMDPVGIQP